VYISKAPPYLETPRPCAIGPEKGLLLLGLKTGSWNLFFC
jgi:hypothetical protein